MAFVYTDILRVTGSIMKYARHQKNPNLERQLSPMDILLQVQSSLFISTCADHINRKDFDQPAYGRLIKLFPVHG